MMVLTCADMAVMIQITL